MTARDQLQSAAKRCERIAAFLYDRAASESMNPYGFSIDESFAALTAHTAADACQESADTLRGIAQVYAGRIP